MNIPKDHHYIPVFYLKQWAGPDCSVLRYWRPNQTMRRSHPTKPPRSNKYDDLIVAGYKVPELFGYERHLYSFPELPPSEASAIESKFLSKADDHASLALNKLLARDMSPWTDDLRSAWARFLFSLPARHPDTIAVLRSEIRQRWTTDVLKDAEAYLSLRSPFQPATIGEYVVSLGKQFAANTDIQFLVGLMDDPNVGEVVANMVWDVVDVSKSAYPLLTSDRPIVIHAIKQRDGHIVIPLNPTTLFSAVNTREMVRKVRSLDPTCLVMEVNKNVVARAAKFVCAPNDRQDLFIRRHMSANKGEPMTASRAIR